MEFVITHWCKLEIVVLYNLNLEQEVRNLAFSDHLNLACSDLTRTDKG